MFKWNYLENYLEMIKCVVVSIFSKLNQNQTKKGGFSWMNKYFKFTLTELQEIASLIAGRELVTARRDDILSELYDELVIEMRRRRTIADEFQLKLE